MNNKTINIFTENIYPDWDLDEFKAITVGRNVFNYYLENLLNKSCLSGFDFETMILKQLLLIYFSAIVIKLIKSIKNIEKKIILQI